MSNRAHPKADGHGTLKRLTVLIALLSTSLFVALPAGVRADGGPVVPPKLFAELKEGRQVAVITIQSVKAARVDLFVSILDQTGESHDVVFFVPLGTNAGAFEVREQDSVVFNISLTSQLDSAIFSYHQKGQQIVEALFVGALFTNGVWLAPLWLPFLLTGCAAPAPAPTATFKTDSSEVNVFSIDESTDLEALAGTAGLSPSVTETLARLRGQQIAVVNLRTRPRAATQPATGQVPSGEPGLHLTWMTGLVPGESGATYVYPLGTGAAWAHPIEWTGVYVVAPPEFAVSVKYPRLGQDLSGFTRTGYRNFGLRIATSGKTPAYAVDSARSQPVYTFIGTPHGYPSYGHPRTMNVWRFACTNSNATEDIVVTVRKSSGIGLSDRLRQAGEGWAFLIGLGVAVCFWVLSWHRLMPQLLSREHPIKGLWLLSLAYLGWNIALLVPAAILFGFLTLFRFGSQFVAMSAPGLLFGGVGVLVFFTRHLPRLGVSTGQAARAFAIVTLASNGAYLAFVLAYAALIDAL